MTKHQIKSEREEQILKAAVVCFARGGFDKTTMDDIALEAGLSKGSLYRYYTNKQQLFLAILEWYTVPFEAEITQLIAQLPTASAKLTGLVDMMLQTNLDPELAQLSNITVDFYAQTRLDEEVNRSLRSALEHYFGFFDQIIQEGIASGEFREVNPRQIGIGLMALLDGLGLYHMLGVEGFDMATFAKALLEIVLKGLKK